MSLDEAFVAALRQNPAQADLNEQDRVMVAFVIRLTKQPSSLIEADVNALRAVGFNDQAILQITMIASWFNYVNRIADALGLGKASEQFNKE